MTLLNRRDWLSSLAAWPLDAVGQTLPPTLDLHVHLFGTGDSGSGCRLSDIVQNGFQFRALTIALNIRAKGATLDEGYSNVLADHVKNSGLTKCAILGQDAVYESNGEPNWARTSFYTPNDYVFKITAQDSKTIPCPSINPMRKDAIDELERIHAKGAKLFKIHPPTQGVNVADVKHTKFYRRCAELKIVIMVHTGHEHSAPVIDKDLANPARLELMLEQGATVVACHAGSGWASDTPDQLPAFASLLKRYPKLWGDTSVLGTAGRVRDFYRLLDDPSLRDRLLHGSDFPFPISPISFSARVGKEQIAEMARQRSWIAKDFQLKQALGVGQASAERAWKMIMG